MATWWELTIPAVATLMGGLTGVWWQSQSSLRLIVKQSEIAQKTRNEDEQARRYMQLFDLRREAYVNFLDAAAQFVNQSGIVYLTSTFLAWKQARTEADEAMMTREKENAQKLADAALLDLGHARESISLLAPREVIYAAGALWLEARAASARGGDNDTEPPDMKYYNLARTRFILKAREDMGLPPDEVSETIEERWREMPKYGQRLRERRASQANNHDESDAVSPSADAPSSGKTHLEEGKISQDLDL